MNMKRMLLSVMMAAVAIAAVGCEQFTVMYDRVENDDFRLLNILCNRAEGPSVRNTPEIAPGDTMVVTAIFAGKPRSDEELWDLLGLDKWWISFNIRSSLMGSNTILDTMSFLEAKAERMDRPIMCSDGTMCMSFRIPIPKDIMRKSESIPEKLIDMIPPGNRDKVPDEFATLTKSLMIDAVELAIDLMKDDNNRPDRLPEGIADMLSYLAVPIRLGVSIPAEFMTPGRLPHTIRSDHVIRYNRHFEQYVRDGVSINRNPVIDRIIAFKVKGDRSMFDNKRGAEYCRLYVRNKYEAAMHKNALTIEPPSEPVLRDWVLTIPVEKGHSYFLEAIVSDYSRDAVLMEADASGRIGWVEELFDAYWLFNLDDSETAGVKQEDYMDIVNGTGALWVPNSPKIKNFRLWVQVSDMIRGDRMRPDGNAFAEVKGFFDHENDMSLCNMGVWVK